MYYILDEIVIKFLNKDNSESLATCHTYMDDSNVEIMYVFIYERYLIFYSFA